MAILICALVAVGLTARAVRYLLRFPLWGDEVALAANLLDRGWLELLEPLDHDQVAPLGFLWAELASAGLVGFSEYALRLPAFVCSLASVALFLGFARRMVEGASLVLAVGIFAVSYPCIRYAAEAKHYACELLASALLLWVLAQWITSGRPKWLWLLGLVIPGAMLLSFTAVFIAGGALVTAALWMLLNAAGAPQQPIAAAKPDTAVRWRGRLRHVWRSSQGAQLRHRLLAWTAAVVSLFLSGAAVYWLTIKPQSQAHLTGMQACWEQSFPPLAQPLRLPMWLLDTFTGQMLAYPVGGHCFGSTLTFLLCATAVVVWWRRGRWVALSACLAPLALTLVAAALRRYPCGGMVRFQLYMAPIFCLLAGQGLATWLSWLPVKRRSLPLSSTPFDNVGGVALLIACAGLMAIGSASILRDVARPYKADIDRQYRTVVQRLWPAEGEAARTICLWSDWGITFSPETWRTRAAAMYLCNKRIYAPVHTPRREPDGTHLPLRPEPGCFVDFYCPDQPYDDQQRSAWLQQMEKRRRLARVCFFSLGDAANPQGAYRAEALVTVYCFEPMCR